MIPLAISTSAIGELISSISSLLWPLLAFTLIIIFRRVIRDLIRSANSRGFSIKVAGNELTMQNATELQQS